MSVIRLSFSLADRLDTKGQTGVLGFGRRRAFLETLTQLWIEFDCPTKMLFCLLSLALQTKHPTQVEMGGSVIRLELDRSAKTASGTR
jgi:hypothetical protein